MSTIDECIHAVLDTNTFLHYQTLDQIHWCEFLSAGNVNLVISHRCLIELNEKKDDPSSLYQRRANKRIKRLQKLINKEKPTHVRSNVTVEFGPPPTIDYDKFGLDRNTPDCQIIASALEMAEKTNSQVVVVTDDIAMMSIVSNYSETRHVSIPNKYQLQRLVSETDKELEKLRRENEQLKNQRPRVNICFANGKQNADFKLKSYHPIALKEEMQKLRDTHPEMEFKNAGWDPFVQLGGIANIMGTPSAEQVQLYNNKRKDFFVNYERWLSQDLADYQRKFAQTIEIPITLINSGTVPAEAIEVHLSLSGPFWVSDKKLAEPKPPTAPQKPRARLASYADLNFNKDLYHDINLMSDLSRFNGPTMKVTCTEGSELSDGYSFDVLATVPKLKHHMEIELDTLYVTLIATGAAVNGFNIGFMILADNMTERITGCLRVNIKQ